MMKEASDELVVLDCGRFKHRRVSSGSFVVQVAFMYPNRDGQIEDHVECDSFDRLCAL